ncbi:MAG: hypothetical protein FJ087_04530 [Deltaproteobacteria bacterium]|nr:hypothetical protein [Deltaproteobacteria bacterium]
MWPDQGSDDCDADQVFVVELNQPVAPSRLESATTFRLARGTPIRARVWAPSRDEARLARQRLGAWFLNDGAVERGTMFLVRPARPLPLDSAFALRVDAGLVGREGPLPSAVAASREYRTYGPLKVVGTGCGASCTPDQPWEASLRFSNPVGSLEFRRKVMRVRDDRDDGPGWYSHEHRALERPQAGRDYEAVVPADLTDSHGQSLGREVRVRYSFGHWPPQFEDWGGGGVMESDGPRRYAFAVRNVSRILADLAPVPLDRAARVLSALAGGTPDLKGLGLAPAAVTIGVSAPLDASGVAALDLAPALGGGRTGIVAYRARAEAAGRGDLGIVHAGAVQVTDLALTAKASPETVVLWVTRLSTGEPQGGVAVEMRADDDAVLWSGSTAPDGRAEAPGTDTLALRLPPPPKVEARTGGGDDVGDDGDGWAPDADQVRSRLFAVARAGTDATALRLSDARLVWAETPSVEGDAYDEEHGSDERWRSVVVTDRDLYREGETVRMKGWVRRMTGRGPLRVPGGTATLEVLPPQEDEDPPGPVARTPVFFDDWGSFSVSWAVPAGARHGPYSVRIELPGEATTHAASFQVTFFEPPEFSVTAALDRPEYVRGDVAGASLRAAYYFGAPMAEAPVTYSFYTPRRRRSSRQGRRASGSATRSIRTSRRRRCRRTSASRARATGRSTRPAPARAGTGCSPRRDPPRPSPSRPRSRTPAAATCRAARPRSCTRPSSTSARGSSPGSWTRAARPRSASRPWTRAASRLPCRRCRSSSRVANGRPSAGRASATRGRWSASPWTWPWRHGTSRSATAGARSGSPPRSPACTGSAPPPRTSAGTRCARGRPSTRSGPGTPRGAGPPTAASSSCPTRGPTRPARPRGSRSTRPTRMAPPWSRSSARACSGSA